MCCSLAGWFVGVVVAMYEDVTDVEQGMAKILSIVSWRLQNETHNADVSVKHGDHEYACFQYLFKYYHRRVFHIRRGRS